MGRRPGGPLSAAACAAPRAPPRFGRRPANRHPGRTAPAPLLHDVRSTIRAAGVAAPARPDRPGRPGDGHPRLAAGARLAAMPGWAVSLRRPGRVRRAPGAAQGLAGMARLLAALVGPLAFF